MKQVIRKAVELGDRLGHIFVATADAQGLPHLAASRKIRLEADDRIGVYEWFCPGTLSNIRDNSRMALVVWDPEKDTGYQILGVCERIEEISMMNGFSPDSDKNAPLPQVERKILLRIDKVLHFSHAPHSDVEE